MDSVNDEVLMDSLLSPQDRTETHATHTGGYGGTTHVTQSGGHGGHISTSLAQGSMEGQGHSVVTCHDIHYTVQVKDKPCCGGKVPKEILKGIDGIFKPGMNAILGPTGSGKSSLLDALAGRKEPHHIQGSILLDGMPPPDNFKCMVGYVVQDDVVMGTLSVRENLEFSAHLRLPSSVTAEDRRERVEKVIYELGLTEVADSKVGNEFIRGISGGERKRCNIGMELIISPPVLFLDEPTTGLDASTANAVMKLLKRLSSRGRTIIFSIHQPRYSIYRLFDSIMLLSRGDVVYHGVAQEAMTFFSSIGYECEAFNNPPDFFLDIINGDSTAVTNDNHVEKVAPSNGVMHHNNHNGHVIGDSPRDTQVVVLEDDPATLTNSYKKSIYYQKVQDHLSPILKNFEAHGDSFQVKTVEYASSFSTQLVVVSGRALKNLFRNPQASILQFVIIAFFAIIVGAVYFKVNDSKDSGIQNRTGAFFFIIMNQVFGNMSAVELFIKERAIFMHENVSGFYRVSAFFLAKVFCDVIPMRFIPSCIFAGIAYYMIGLRGGADHFFYFALMLFMTALSASALSFFISSSVRVMAMANLFLALSYVMMMLFSGLLVNIGDLGDWLQWIKYFSIFRYSLNALSINELKDQNYCNNATDCIPGNEFLEAQGIPFGTDWDLWSNTAALGVITVVFLVLGYVQLRRIKKM